ncbi:MAG: GNAT family N-acetyltransferase [Streptosporangiaceae bacterium]
MNAIAAEPIRTARLTLVPLTPEHAGPMAAVLGDQALHAFTGGSPLGADALRARYERWSAGPADPAVSWCNWVIRLDEAGCLTGTVQATFSVGAAPDGRSARAEVAWVVGTKWQRQGIATEAARALVSWLGRRGAGAVVAHIHPDHHASAAVAAAAGLRPTGRLSDGEQVWSTAPES